MISNAEITMVILGFSNESGSAGRNFKLSFELKLSEGGNCICDLNPYKIPELLKLLDIDNFDKIKGCYVQVEYTGNYRPDKIRNILSRSSDDWFHLDNGIYFGSEIKELKK